MLKEGDYMCKIDLKEAYFTTHLGELYHHLVKFYGKRVIVNSCVYSLVLYQPLEY